MSLDDNRQYAAATERNREPILKVLQQVLPPKGTVLEVASGTGEHATFFAPRLAPRKWLPSDPNPKARASILAWQTYLPADNLYPPLELDAADLAWPVEEQLSKASSASRSEADSIVAMVSINMIHIAPWSACLGLLAAAGRILPSGGILYLYGPFKVQGQMVASNASFDQFLQAQNPAWGVRDLEQVVAAAQTQHLRLLETYPMPANNLSVVFEHK